MTPRKAHTASSWLCDDRAVRSDPRSHSSISTMDETYTDDDTDDDDNNDDDTDDDNDDESI